MNTKVFRNLSYGLYAISTLDGDRPTGCIANSAMQITSAPATIALSMNHDNYTNSCIKAAGMFAISILSESSDPAIIGTLGFQSGKDIDKFDSIAHEIKSGLPIVSDTCGYIVCKVINQMETSTHTVFLGEVIDGDTLAAAAPMTYTYYHQVIKGKSPKNAPTYLPDDSDSTASQSSKHVCSICKYVYDGEVPFDQLPADYVCPICKAAKDKFTEEA